MNGCWAVFRKHGKDTREIDGVRSCRATGQRVLSTACRSSFRQEKRLLGCAELVTDYRHGVVKGDDTVGVLSYEGVAEGSILYREQGGQGTKRKNDGWTDDHGDVQVTKMR